ncbi:MAG TPA: F0F1 ATP synthase subunit epsilon [Candidatus Sulfotelmatobacter sp.]|nr:F0F1 ATP synthase subunit epsilon [Candidatus Sulfotelmatobacter sp.]
MLSETIELEVVTPERHVLTEKVDSLEMPGKEGYLGILPGHAPLITELGVGVLTYRKGTESRRLTVINGYAEVLPDRVIVLAELSERAEEIDVARVKSALARAQAQLAKAGSPDVDWELASFALQRAMVRLQAASKEPVPAGNEDRRHTSS